MCSNRICSVCGNPIQKIDKFKPSIYCSDTCRDFSKFKNAFEKSIIKLRPTKEARKLLRGDIFRLCNLLGNGTNTILDLKNDL